MKCTCEDRGVGHLHLLSWLICSWGTIECTPLLTTLPGYWNLPAKWLSAGHRARSSGIRSQGGSVGKKAGFQLHAVDV